MYSPCVVGFDSEAGDQFYVSYSMEDHPGEGLSAVLPR